MAKTTRKRTPRSKPTASPAKPGRERPKRSDLKDKPTFEARVRSGTKQARAIEMLRSAEGASIAALMQTTG